MISADLFVVGRLLARTDDAGQSRVIGTIFRVPQRQAQLDAAGQDAQLFRRAGRGLGRAEVVILVGNEVLVVPAFQNGLKNVPHVSPSNELAVQTGKNG